MLYYCARSPHFVKGKFIMIKILRLSFALTLSLFAAQLTFAQASSPIQSSVSNSGAVSDTSALTRGPDEKRKLELPARSIEASPAVDRSESVIADPLVRMLVTKGILTEVEGHSISANGTALEQRDRLASLLRDKG